MDVVFAVLGWLTSALLLASLLRERQRRIEMQSANRILRLDEQRRRQARYVSADSHDSGA